MPSAQGNFSVKPRTDVPAQPLPDIGRTLLDKQWSGDLTGHSSVEMLSFMTSVPGSAAYVALEVVQATLHGRQGRFAFYRLGLSERGHQSLTYGVVPDSGTHELTGLSGQLDLKIVDGAHQYTFSYALPEAQED
ncbi:DUF3224 domain-containing protein [Deinococcus sp.]|uniref:DUF3224 domain-containing protein n=1 Tax=Deinococcus sp. TaxID=47478 RepID=UPI003CC619E0